MNNELINREALKETIETYDKFAYLPNGKLCPFRDLVEPEMYVPYIHFDDVIKAIDNVGDIHDFIAKADEGTLFQLKKEIENALTKIIEREAQEEARREAMKLDENEDSLKWRFTH